MPYKTTTQNSNLCNLHKNSFSAPFRAKKSRFKVLAGVQIKKREIFSLAIKKGVGRNPIKIMRSQKTSSWLKVFTSVILVTLISLLAIVAVNAEEQDTESTDLARYELFFETMIEAIDNGKNTAEIVDLGISFTEIDDFVNAFASTHPNYSFFFESFSYLNSPATGLVHSVTLIPDNMETVANRKNWINSQVKSIAEQIDPEWHDVYKLMWISDYIADHFDYEAEKSEYHDVYNFLFYGEGVCQAYTGLFTLIAREAGFNVSFAMSSDVNHVWNLVELDGEWYVIDATWNDRYVSRYDYFLLGGDVHYREVCGIYGISSFEYFSLYEPNGTKYDDAFWEGLFSSLAVTDYGYYFVEDGYIHKANLDTLSTAVTALVGNFKWKVNGYESQYYSDKFHDTVGFEGKMFYSTPKNIYLLDLSTGEQTSVYTNDHEFEIYGFYREGDDLVVVHYDAENGIEYKTAVEDAFVPPKVYCSVSFKVGDKVVSEIQVEKGTAIPVPKDPTLASTAYYDYEFLGWKNFEEGMIATENAIVIEAEFKEILRSYLLQYIDKNGSVEHSVLVEAGTAYGNVEEFVGAHVKTDAAFYIFTQWTGLSPEEIIISNVTVTAQYQEVLRFDILNEDSENLTALYGAITSAILSGEMTVDVLDLGLNVADIDMLEKLYARNNPYTAFAFNEITGYTAIKDLNLVKTITVSAEVNGIEGKIDQIETRLDMIVKEINVDWTPLQKVLWINDYICDNYRYDNTIDAVGLYGIVMNGTGRDIDYVHLFAAIAGKVGIKTSTVYSATIKHYWSMVEIDGEWFNIDVTTNDSYAGRYKLFLLNDSDTAAILGKNRDLKLEAMRTSQSDKYTSAFWTNGHYCSIMPSKEGAYTIYEGRISYVNLETLEITAIRAVGDYTWDDPSASKVLTTKHYDLLVVGDLILYSTPAKVFVYSLVTKDHQALYTSNKQDDIFSIHLEGNLLAMMHCSDVAKDITAKSTIVLDNFYKVTFIVDNKVYATQTYYSGNTLESPTAPEIEGFKFVGWSVEDGVAVTSDMTVTANYEAKKDMATITFVSDGAIYRKVTVELGSLIILPNVVPTKAPDEYSEYVFVSWEGYTSGMTADQSTIVLVAKYKAMTRKYSVKFFDGNTLLLSATYEAGTPFKNVAKPSVTDKVVGGVKYSFAGWSDTPDKVLSDLIISAIYEQEPAEYTITYYNGEKIVHQEKVPEGSVLNFISTVPTKESTDTHRYYFEKWVGATEGTVIDRDIVLNASFMEVEIETTPDTEPDTEPDTQKPTSPQKPSDENPQSQGNNDILGYCIIAAVGLMVIALIVVAITRIRRN